MKIFVLLTTGLDCTTVFGVYSTRALAENAGRKLDEDSEIEAHELDAD